MGRIERTLPGLWHVSEGLPIDPNPNLNTAHKTLYNLGYAACHCQHRDSGFDFVIGPYVDDSFDDNVGDIRR
jgi:hypothetical protein